MALSQARLPPLLRGASAIRYAPFVALGRYREEVLLGTGGMAEVWRARGPNGVVALKRLLPHAARNASVASAFEREGRLLARIAHPNVIAIEEIVRDERGTCLVLEYVEGADLRAASGKPISERLALRIAHDLLEALAAVHGLRDDDGRALGLIHRDLSPANVLVGVQGTVKLTDFGIARGRTGSHATTGQNIKGTLAYLSPEQARGAPVDARSDLFSVGALLFEMLTGTPIYDEDEPRLALARARAGEVSSLTALRPQIAFPIAELVDRALAERPSDRFATATAMLSELERVAAQTSGMASNEELGAFARRLVQESDKPALRVDAAGHRRPSRAPRIIALSFAAVLVFAAGLGWLLRARRPAEAVVPPRASSPAAIARETTAAPVPAGSEAAPMPAASAALPEAPSTEAARTAAPMPKTLARRRLVEEPANAKRDNGLLDIGSEPGFAYVTIDGVQAGATPLFGKEVAPGTHLVNVSREGFGSKSFTVEVRSGDRISRVVKFP